MTDFEMADVIYIEPLVADVVAKIVEKERPGGILAGLGAQTALNMTAELAELGVLSKYDVKVLGTPLEAIYDAEDRERFKKTMERINELISRGVTVNSVAEAEEVATELGLPVIIRPSYTLGGTGGGIARTLDELRGIVSYGLQISRIHQVLVEESVLDWKEIEYEVMRDAKDTCITICNMEKLDAMGIHTGESIVVTPTQTLTDDEHQMLSGYPIARVAAKIAIGLHLDEIRNHVTAETPASFEPAIDYVVVKIPRWPFDKFSNADRTLTTSMKSTGEVMAIGRTFEEALQKALRSLDIDKDFDTGYENWSETELKHLLETPTDDRIFTIYEALKRGIGITEIAELSCIDPFFIKKIAKIVHIEAKLKVNLREHMRKAKRMGFTDKRIASLTGRSREEISDYRREEGLLPTYKMVDTCAAEFEAKTPYFYSSYEQECELKPSARRKVLIIGAAPIRIGQGIEFDYCTVHAVKALKEEGIEAHIINNNPETVSTDYDTSDKLFFEPLTREDVMNVIEKENYDSVMVQFGGQTSVNLAVPLKKELKRLGLKTVIMGTDPENIDMAEDRGRFSNFLLRLRIPQADSGYATSLEGAKEVVSRIGFPVLVRPSYVLGGRAMVIVHDEEELIRYMREAMRISKVNEGEIGHVAVKEVVLPFLKFTGVDTILGPEMKSTGEVMGIDEEFDKAFFKSELAAYNPLPLDTGSTVFISVCEEDRAVIEAVAQNLKKAGLSIVGTEGTVAYLRQRGINADGLRKVHEESPNVIEMMHAQAIKLVINTPTDKQSYKDKYQIRRACIELGIPYITTMQAAKAAASAIVGMKGNEIEVKSVNEYFK